MSENTGSSKKRKAISATLTIAMVATMLLSGTLAYFYQSRAKNTITGAEKQVIGHDDFVKVSDTEYNKDIYVENMGSTPVLVRVKLTEAFTLNGKTIADAADKLTHIPEDMGTLTVGTGTSDSDQTADDIHKYFTWKMDGKSKSYISGNSTLYQSHEDKDVFYSYEVGKVAQNNSKKDYSTAAKIDADTTLSAAMKADLKENLKTTLSGAGKIITMKEYMGNAPEWRKNFTGWVIDNSKKDADIIDAEGTATTEAANGDGWAYWSQMLKPGQATSLLLNSITIDEALADADYTYDIYVDFEAVDTTDEGVWTDPADHDASNMPVVTTDKLQTTGAKTLISTAKTVYTAACGDIPDQIETIRARTESKAVLSICDKATSKLGAGTLSEACRQEIAQSYVDMANAILTADKATLAQPVLVYKDGAVHDSGKLQSADIDVNLAKYIIDTYDYNGDGTLTEEEALSVIELTIPGITVSSLNGLNLDNFKNLRYLWLFNTKGYSSIDLKHFTKKVPNLENPTETMTVGLHTLIIDVPKNLTGEVDVSVLKDTLKYLQISHSNKDTSFTGINLLTNMEYLYFCVTPSIKLTTTEFCDLLHKSADTLSTFVWQYTDIYSDTEKKIPITTMEQLTGAKASDNTPFAIPPSIRFLYFEDKTITGTLSLQNLPKLTTLIFGGNAGLICDITSCNALQNITASGNATITGTLPAGVNKNF